MNRFKVTNRSFAWEILNSVWILFSFLGMGFISFFIIGKKARQKKWMYCGIVYLALWIISLVFLCISHTLFLDMGNIIFWVSVFVSIIHCLKVRNKYLICRDIVVKANLDAKAKREFREQIIREYEEKGIINAKEQKRSEVINSLQQQQKEEKETAEFTVVDINTCSMQELESLPGITVVKAKQAETYRNEHKGFSSLDEFYKVVDLKPHFILQLEGKITCSLTEKDTDSDNKEKKGRVLDF